MVLSENTDFLLSVYDDYRLATRLIQDLRKHYPFAQIFCLADGTKNKDFCEFAISQRVHYFEDEDNRFRLGERLKTSDKGGAWLHRMFEVGLYFSDSQHFIRTEGDTRFWRSFDYLPHTSIGGTLNTRFGIDFPRGGCVYFHRKALQQIVNSRLLLDPCYCNSSKFSYERYGACAYPDEKWLNEQIALTDLILGDVISRIKLPLSSWNEVNIQFRDLPKVNGLTQFAATHPHR